MSHTDVNGIRVKSCCKYLIKTDVAIDFIKVDELKLHKYDDHLYGIDIDCSPQDALLFLANELNINLTLFEVTNSTCYNLFLDQ